MFFGCGRWRIIKRWNHQLVERLTKVKRPNSQVNLIGLRENKQNVCLFQIDFSKNGTEFESQKHILFTPQFRHGGASPRSYNSEPQVYCFSNSFLLLFFTNINYAVSRKALVCVFDCLGPDSAFHFYVLLVMLDTFNWYWN